MVCAAAMTAMGAQAKVRLPHMIGDNMVLQQNTEARLWGWDKPGKKVKVTPTWNNETYTAKTGDDGKWMVKVKCGCAPDKATWRCPSKASATVPWKVTTWR